MKTPTLKLALISGAMLGGVLLSSCRVSRPNPEHCFHAGGDQTCAEIDPQLPFCEIPECGSRAYGCVAEQPSADCHSPCGADTTAEQDVSCVEVGVDTETETDTDTGLETDTETDTSEDDCQTHADCPTDAAFCLFGTCSACDGAPDPNGACFVLTDGEAPVCLDGECVECTSDQLDLCIDAQLACDSSTNTCIPCTHQSQCPGDAGCDVVFGSCLPADAVWHVDGDGGHDFTTIAEAMAEIGDGSGTIILHENNFGQEYPEGISFAGDHALAILNVGKQHPKLFTDDVSLAVSAGARVYARGLTLHGSIAVRATAGSHIEIDSCRLGPLDEHALRLDDSVLVMRNSMLRGVWSVNFPALAITGTSSIDISYSTIVSLGEPAAMVCVGTMAPGSRIRNSLIGKFADGEVIYCSGVSFENNGLELIEWNKWKRGNTQIGDMSGTWFKDPPPGDLHLTPQAPVVLTTAAMWAEGDPLVDIDGDPRPGIEGALDFVGADRFP
jgi:hypothetical protein